MKAILPADLQTTEALLAFLRGAPTPYHAVSSMAETLHAAGFQPLREDEPWHLTPGTGYTVTRNDSSLLAFALPKEPSPSFMLAASHTDSPTFKLKMRAEADTFGMYTRLSVENYGGMIYSTWLDRPLSVAGRLILRDGERFRVRNVYIDRDLALIPSVAIHQMRTCNSGFAWNPAVDLQPLFGGAGEKLLPLLAESAGVEPEEIADADLFLVNRTPGAIWGAKNEFFSSPRIDNLQCAYATLQGFLAAGVREKGAVSVYAAFDNEETGSATKQGAGSFFLRDTLARIAEALGYDLRRMLASSFFVSADNGHARHPNHPELSDERNCPHLNEGIVLKNNAAQKYTTDALSAALFREICRRADVPLQVFHNRSDMPGGSTLGSIANTTVAACTVDIGLPQLAMHSAYETAGTADTACLIRASEALFSAVTRAEADGMTLHWD